VPIEDKRLKIRRVSISKLALFESFQELKPWKEKVLQVQRCDSRTSRLN